jgi:hypothetical protein
MVTRINIKGCIRSLPTDEAIGFEDIANFAVVVTYLASKRE